MSIKIPISTIALAGMIVGVTGQSLAQDGADLYKAKACNTCHGENGGHPLSPEYPVLAGQNARYLLRQMIDIRDGQRTNGLSATMKAAVVGVADNEFAAIAEWLAGQY